MAIKSYKPTTPGRRKMTTLVNDEITKFAADFDDKKLIADAERMYDNY